MSNLVRELIITPGFDKRDADPKKNYGVGGCNLRFYVHNARRTKSVQLILYTCWLPPKTQEEAMYKDHHIGTQPMGADLGYHSPKPMYKGQSRMVCDLSKRGYCFYDGSGLAADRLRDILLTEGSDKTWEALEEYWHELFEPPTNKE